MDTVIIDLRHFNLFKDIDVESFLSDNESGGKLGVMISEAPSLTYRSQEQNQVTFSMK